MVGLLTIYVLTIILYSIWYIIKCPVYCRSKRCLIKKTAIVTGANRGLGYETALDLASRGCRVILATRSNCDEVRNKIIRITNNPNIVYKNLDLCSLASVRKFAKDFNETEERLDILINNAGIAGAALKPTEDGLHPICQTNHFGPFLLTHLLIEKLKKSAPSRIIFVSSLLAFRHNLTLDTIDYPMDTGEPIVSTCLKIYANTKLCNLLTANTLAEKLKGTGVSCHSAHPGWAYTDVSGQMRDVKISELYIWFHFTFMLPLMTKTAESGAQAIIKAAVSEEYEEKTGIFVWERGWFPSPFKCRDKAFAGEIWSKTEEILHFKPVEKL